MASNTTVAHTDGICITYSELFGLVCWWLTPARERTSKLASYLHSTVRRRVRRGDVWFRLLVVLGLVASGCTMSLFVPVASGASSVRIEKINSSRMEPLPACDRWWSVIDTSNSIMVSSISPSFTTSLALVVTSGETIHVGQDNRSSLTVISRQPVRYSYTLRSVPMGKIDLACDFMSFDGSKLPDGHQWILLPAQSINTHANERSRIEFSVVPPPSTPTGSYYAVIRLTDKSHVPVDLPYELLVGDVTNSDVQARLNARTGHHHVEVLLDARSSGGRFAPVSIEAYTWGVWPGSYDESAPNSRKMIVLGPHQHRQTALNIPRKGIWMCSHIVTKRDLDGVDRDLDIHGNVSTIWLPWGPVSLFEHKADPDYCTTWRHNTLARRALAAGSGGVLLVIALFITCIVKLLRRGRRHRAIPVE